MSKISTIHLQRLQDQPGNLAYETMKMRFSYSNPDRAWSPALNIYRCEQCVVVCADLAGVDKTAIDLQVTPQHLLIRGRREPPDPGGEACKTMQVLATEVDSGPFKREVLFPEAIDTARVTAEQKNGILWVYLPLLTEA